MPGRKPTRLLELSGAFRKHPERRRPAEPKDSRELGDPPERLPSEAKQFWAELESLCPPGVLRRPDRWCVELASLLMLKAVRQPDNEAVVELIRIAQLSTQEAKQLICSQRITSSELATLRSLLSAMGLTPGDRSKLCIATDKPTNRFADLVAKPN